MMLAASVQVACSGDECDHQLDAAAHQLTFGFSEYERGVGEATIFIMSNLDIERIEF